MHRLPAKAALKARPPRRKTEGSAEKAACLPKGGYLFLKKAKTKDLFQVVSLASMPGNFDLRYASFLWFGLALR